jgi:hypothetical protein
MKLLLLDELPPTDTLSKNLLAADEIVAAHRVAFRVLERVDLVLGKLQRHRRNPLECEIWSDVTFKSDVIMDGTCGKRRRAAVSASRFFPPFDSAFRRTRRHAFV